MERVDTVLLGEWLLTMDGRDTRFKNGGIAVRGDRIVAVGPREVIAERYEGRETVDMPRGLIMPGLVNSHTHAAMTCFRGIADDLPLMEWLNDYIFPAEAKNVNPELAYWGSLLACAEMILSGTTTFCDMYIFEAETALAAREAGVRCLLGEVLFDFPSPSVKTPQEGLEYTERMIRDWAGDPLVNIVVEPHALYTCSPDLLREAGKLAEKHQVPIATHFLETAGEKAMLEEKLGRKPVHYLQELGYLHGRFFAFHAVAMDEEDINLFARHGCGVVHNPESNMKLASGVAPVSAMLREGVTVGLGTDGCASNNNLDMLQEMDTAAKLEKCARLDPTIQSAETVLRMATIEGAKVLGLDGLTGSLEAGKKADIVVLDIGKPHLTPLYNPVSHLVYAASGADVDSVWINGRRVLKERKLLTVDVEAVMDRVRHISERIAGSLAP